MWRIKICSLELCSFQLDVAPSRGPCLVAFLLVAFWAEQRTNQTIRNETELGTPARAQQNQRQNWALCEERFLSFCLGWYIDAILGHKLVTNVFWLWDALNFRTSSTEQACAVQEPHWEGNLYCTTILKATLYYEHYKRLCISFSVGTPKFGPQACSPAFTIVTFGDTFHGRANYVRFGWPAQSARVFLYAWFLSAYTSIHNFDMRLSGYCLGAYRNNPWLHAFLSAGLACPSAGPLDFICIYASLLLTCLPTHLKTYTL